MRGVVGAAAHRPQHRQPARGDVPGHLFNGASRGLRWYDAALGLLVLPGAMLTLSLIARHRRTGPLRFTGTAGTVLNCAVIMGLVINPYTARGAELFYGATLLVAAWRGQRGCESTVLSNWILGRDDQVGCPVFAPIDHAETRLDARGHTPRQGRASQH